MSFSAGLDSGLPAWVPADLPTDWLDVLRSPQLVSTLRQLDCFLRQEWESGVVFPPRTSILRALQLTPLRNVRVVILGQDPYHDKHQANGLAFAVDPPLPLPPSLRNIQRELQQDLQLSEAPGLQLERWAKQGVLLLNTVLTVRAHEANSHRGQGWELITEALLQAVNHRPPTAFILWGAHAGRIAAGLNSRHFVVTSPHPSPLSAWRGFFGSRPFSRVNTFLEAQGEPPVEWVSWGAEGVTQPSASATSSP
ncbi:MAG: Uracil-DNA glycosylase [Planctomycetota bacterium]